MTLKTYQAGIFKQYANVSIASIKNTEEPNQYKSSKGDFSFKFNMTSVKS